MKIIIKIIKSKLEVSVLLFLLVGFLWDFKNLISPIKKINLWINY